MNKKELLAALDSLGMRPGRGLGQNFLLDGNLLDWIVRKSGVAPGDQVLEVGPGFGALTEKLLASGAIVTAIEYDHRLAEYLRKKFSSYQDAFRLVEADACRVNVAALFSGKGEYRSIANLPYSISTVFIARLVDSPTPPRSMFFMLQKEMGERLAAVPGTKAYGALSVRVQFSYQVKLEKIVPPDVFCPPPEVESALVSFVRQEPQPPQEESKRLSQLVRLAFNQRRKQLGKVLGQSFGREETAAIFAALNLPMEVRPDALSVAQFAAMAKEFDKLAQKGKKNV